MGDAWKQLMVAAMEREFQGDRRRIDHALNVLDWAERILSGTPASARIVVAAAILHDIGIPAAEREHGSSAAEWQELEGPPIAERILRAHDADDATISHVCEIIANHHSDGGIDTPEFRIIWDADWLVNIASRIRHADADERHRMIQRTFKTPRGEELARETYL